MMKIPDSTMHGWLPPAEAARIRVVQQEQTSQKQSTVPLSRGLLHCHLRDPDSGHPKTCWQVQFFVKKSALQTRESLN